MWASTRCSSWWKIGRIPSWLAPPFFWPLRAAAVSAPVSVPKPVQLQLPLQLACEPAVTVRPCAVQLHLAELYLHAIHSFHRNRPVFRKQTQCRAHSSDTSRVEEAWRSAAAGCEYDACRRRAEECLPGTQRVSGETTPGYYEVRAQDRSWSSLFDRRPVACATKHC